MQPAATDMAKLQELGLAPDSRDAWADSEMAAAETVQAAAPVPATPAALPQAPEAPSAPPAKQPEPASAAPNTSSVPLAGMVNPEDLFDIVQQAEFYVSIGEHDLAIGELRQHIAERGSSSPFSYLELLRLYHQLGRIEAFDLLRSQFMEHFNAEVPEFSHFAQQGAGLEIYTDALADIEAQWTSNSVLELLESFLFLHPDRASPAPRFDLAAYDDLLLLLAIAQTTPASARGEPAPRKRTTPLMPPTFQPASPEGTGQATAAVAAASAALAMPAIDLAPQEPQEAAAAGALAQEWVPPPSPTVQAELAAAQAGLAFDLGDFDWSPAHAPAPSAPAAPEPAPANDDALTALLEMDFSGPIPLIDTDLPPVAVTPPPAPGQAVGFSSSDEKFELRFELQEQAAKSTEPKP